MHSRSSATWSLWISRIWSFVGFSRYIFCRLSTKMTRVPNALGYTFVTLPLSCRYRLTIVRSAMLQ